MTDYKHLRELCDAATDGEWQWFDSYDFLGYKNNTDWSSENFNAGRIKLCSGGQDGELILGEWSEYASDSGITISEDDARFIAATDPQTVRALIDEIERLRAALEDIADGPEPLGDYMTGIRCGVEDRDLYDRYECAEYGYEEGLEYCAFIAKQALKGTENGTDKK